jgi:antitoxin MazE
MQVPAWGNSLAVRLPAALVAELHLKEGDEVEMSAVTHHRSLGIREVMTREEAMEALKTLPRPMPAGNKFKREDAYER